MQNTIYKYLLKLNPYVLFILVFFLFSCSDKEHTIRSGTINEKYKYEPYIDLKNNKELYINDYFEIRAIKFDETETGYHFFWSKDYISKLKNKSPDLGILLSKNRGFLRIVIDKKQGYRRTVHFEPYDERIKIKHTPNASNKYVLQLLLDRSITTDFSEKCFEIEVPDFDERFHIKSSTHKAESK